MYYGNSVVKSERRASVWSMLIGRHIARLIESARENTKHVHGSILFIIHGRILILLLRYRFDILLLASPFTFDSLSNTFSVRCPCPLSMYHICIIYFNCILLNKSTIFQIIYFVMPTFLSLLFSAEFLFGFVHNFG